MRFYADAGLIVPALRTQGGYRVFDESALRRLRFLRRVQRLGLSLGEIKQLLRTAEQLSCGRSSEVLRRRLARQLEVVDERISELQEIRHELASLVAPSRRECTDELCLCQATQRK